jgi:hypothetical protein
MSSNCNLYDILEYILYLKKSEIRELSFIKTESALKTFLTKKKYDQINRDFCGFKALIPALEKLEDYINKEVDDETNIEEIHRNTNGTQIKKLMNVPNYDQTMKNFYNSKFFIRFKAGKDKMISIRLNENWMSPNLDVPLIPGSLLNAVPFLELSESYNDTLKEKIKKLLENGERITEAVISEKMDEVDMSDFSWNPTTEQAYSVFRSYYHFDPTNSNNNGLHVLILEADENNFGGSPVPVHPVKNIENDLFKLGIKKDEKHPNIRIKVNKFDGKSFDCDLFVKQQKLFSFFLFLRPTPHIQSHK